MSDDPRRAFLEHYQPPRRSDIVNTFLLPVRQGVTSPAEVVARVERAYLQREQQGVRYRDLAYQQRARWVLDGLSAFPAEALALAEWCIAWEATPPGERERLKAERGEEHRRAWLEGQPATPKQLAYLAALGHRGPVASRAEASRLIDRYKAAPRQGGAA
jgi:hypothetical protein